MNHMSHFINIKCRTNFTCLSLKMDGEINWLHKNFYNVTNANHYEIFIFHKHIQFIHFGSTRSGLRLEKHHFGKTQD